MHRPLIDADRGLCAGEDVHGVIFDIQRCALHDGPGIRTTVFLKGCPLRCIWCHNPESQAFEPELSIDGDRCNVQPGAVEIIGRDMSVAEVMSTVARDAAFFERSGGGMTLSGGEPMVQFEFTRELLRAARRRQLHTCLDTCGQARTSFFEDILDAVDVFLYDFKVTDPDRHRELTGVSNGLIMRNLDFLYSRGADIILRCPLIPGVNDSPDHLLSIVELSIRYPKLSRIEILPYHNMGNHKAERIGREAPLRHLGNTDEATKQRWMAALAEAGCTRVILG